MSALRTIKCPACGKTHLLGRPCPCGGKKRQGHSAGSRIVGIVLTFLLTAGGIIGAGLALAEAKGPGYGIALAVGAWLLLHLCRLGYDWEDGIDIRQLMFPGPFDWHIKIESFLNFWTSPRAFFRAAYLGAMLALVVLFLLLMSDLRAGSPGGSAGLHLAQAQLGAVGIMEEHELHPGSSEGCAMPSRSFAFALLLALGVLAFAAGSGSQASDPTAVTAIALLAPRGEDQPAAPLRLKLQPGGTYYQRSVIQQRVVVTGREGERVTNSTIGTGLKFEVLHRDRAGVHRLRVTYDWVSVQTQQGEDRVAYDSAGSNVPETPWGVQYAAQVGQTFGVTMAADGTVLGFEDLPAMHERMAGRITELGGSGQVNLPIIRQAFGEQSLRGGLGLLATVLPKSDVQVGDTWTKTSHNDAGFSRDLDASHRLVEVEQGVATIEVDTAIRPPTPHDGEDVKRSARQWLELTGSDTGSFRVDVATGWIVGGETAQNLEGTTHARRGTEEVVARISITGTTRFTSSRAVKSALSP